MHAGVCVPQVHLNSKIVSWVKKDKVPDERYKFWDFTEQVTCFYFCGGHIHTLSVHKRVGVQAFQDNLTILQNTPTSLN
jgi:hypothetical protein